MSARVAARYAQSAMDPIVIGTESVLGRITSNIAGKIWQKIMIIQQQMAADAPASAVPAPHPGTRQIGQSGLPPAVLKSGQGWAA